ncbi:GNAT family N-acetyltransferase [Yersinia frederiksenii]|uniref:GNAT family N-acetyltransferase n=2 Tax=Yersinia frederiksenii TaxID=29484 RepID=UPI0025AB3FED|nr:peptidase inhibitor family I36 protein [Yersinia frederiksenii]MDN0121576.1 GNAT family N-acetyltransferase [Yersinia frederiksenii]
MKIVTKLFASTILIISQSAWSVEAKICFYELADYQGESFCAEESEANSTYNYDDNFDHGIASISVPPGMIITIYDGINFSGTKKKLKNDINLPELISSGLYQKIKSYQIEPAICFYTEDNYQGDSTCLASNQQIDLYHDSQGIINSDRNVLLVHNDSIKSITIPDGMMATIYKNDNFNAPFFELTESITVNGLKSLGMDSEITGMKATESKELNCDQQCIIIGRHRINLTDAFGSYWDNTLLKNKQLLLVFNSEGIYRDTTYDIKLFGGPTISLNKGNIIFSDLSMISKFYFSLHKEIDRLSFIIQIEDGIVKTQYIQTLNNNLVDISPIILFEWQNTIKENPEIEIINYNIEKPLILAKTILTADTGIKSEKKRDANQISKASKIICAFTPFLNIYNYITQGKCQQLDNIVFSAHQYFNNNTAGKTLHIAGSSRPLSKESLTGAKLPDINSFNSYALLTYIDSTKHNQSLSLPAVAKACMVSIYSLFNSRQTRQIKPHCIDWTLEIMTDFTLLFGHSLETWNAVFFGQIIDSITRTGSTGVEVKDHDVEKRLINAVKEKIMEKNTEDAFNHVRTAFDYAQLSYLGNRFRYLSDESPSQVELLPLGVYELILDTFIYRPIPPTFIVQNEPIVQHDLNFEVEIMTTLSPEEEEKLSDAEIQNAQAMRRRLSETIAQWGEQYQGTHMGADPTADDTQTVLSKILHAGHIVTGIIHRRLIIRRPGEIYVVIKLHGRIIAIILADRFNSQSEVELVASATLPDYVLFPEREGTVRGAGTAAVSELARYLQRQGARTLFSEVISHPSARVKQKLGFNFKNEF